MNIFATGVAAKIDGVDNVLYKMHENDNKKPGEE